MRCDKCGHEAQALKTCRRRDDEGTGVLCDSCWEPVRHLVWIVPGPWSVTAKCTACGRYCNPSELRGRTTYAQEMHRGTCRSCMQEM